MSRKVFIAHADGDVDIAEQVAAPLRHAGYEVCHFGTMLVGDSVVEEAAALIHDGAPVVVCGTIRAAGTAWVHKITNAAHVNPGRVFVLQVDKDAYLDGLSLARKVGNYWQDPVGATRELLAALAKYFPDGTAAQNGTHITDPFGKALAAIRLEFLGETSLSKLRSLDDQLKGLLSQNKTHADLHLALSLRTQVRDAIKYHEQDLRQRLKRGRAAVVNFVADHAGVKWLVLLFLALGGFATWYSTRPSTFDLKVHLSGTTGGAVGGGTITIDIGDELRTAPIDSGASAEFKQIPHSFLGKEVRMRADVAGYLQSWSNYRITGKDIALPVVPGVDPLAIRTDSLPDARVGSYYSQTISGTGGTQRYKWALSQGDVPGLNLDARTGELSGTPISAGAFDISVTLSDGAASAAKGLTVHVQQAGAVRIETTRLADGTVGIAYADPIVATGGTGRYGWRIASGGVPGLSLDGSTGALTGTPASPGTYRLSVRVEDSGRVASREFRVRINRADDVSISTQTLADAVVGERYSQPITANGAVGRPTWSTTSGAVAGLSLDTQTGELSGVPTREGPAQLSIRVTDSRQRSATAEFTIRVAPRLAIKTASLPEATVGVPFSQSLGASGGAGALKWEMSRGGSGWLSLSSEGVLSGVPLTAGPVPMSVRVTDIGGGSAVADLSLVVRAKPTPICTITTEPELPPANLADRVSLSLRAECPGSVARWSTEKLPPGLTLDAGTGAISGTPSIAGIYSFPVQIKDVEGHILATREFSLNVLLRVFVQKPSPILLSTEAQLFDEVITRCLKKPPFAYVERGTDPHDAELICAGCSSRNGVMPIELDKIVGTDKLVWAYGIVKQGLSLTRAADQVCSGSSGLKVGLTGISEAVRSAK